MRAHTFSMMMLLAMISFASPMTQAEQPLSRAIDLIRQGKPESAVPLLQLLAKSGDAKAQYQLGLLLYSGKGIVENEKAAVELLTKSANQGHVEAMYQLGNAFTFGNDTPRLVADADVEAAKWYFKAASAGNADAQYSLGLLFLTGKGVEKNEKEATYWMQMAAKNGHKDASGYLSTGR